MSEIEVVVCQLNAEKVAKLLLGGFLGEAAKQQGRSPTEVLRDMMVVLFKDYANDPVFYEMGSIALTGHIDDIAEKLTEEIKLKLERENYN